MGRVMETGFWPMSGPRSYFCRWECGLVVIKGILSEDGSVAGQENWRWGQKGWSGDDWRLPGEQLKAWRGNERRKNSRSFRDGFGGCRSQLHMGAGEGQSQMTEILLGCLLLDQGDWEEIWWEGWWFICAEPSSLTGKTVWGKDPCSCVQTNLEFMYLTRSSVLAWFWVPQ